MNIFRELWRNKTLVWKLGKNDFKTKYAGSYFGILWAFVQPMVTILIYNFYFPVWISRYGYAKRISVCAVADCRYYSLDFSFQRELSMQPTV